MVPPAYLCPKDSRTFVVASLLHTADSYWSIDTRDPGARFSSLSRDSWCTIVVETSAGSRLARAIWHDAQSGGLQVRVDGFLGTIHGWMTIGFSDLSFERRSSTVRGLIKCWRCEKPRWPRQNARVGGPSEQQWCSGWFLRGRRDWQGLDVGRMSREWPAWTWWESVQE